MSRRAKQSDGLSSEGLHRVALRLVGEHSGEQLAYYKFLINPEDYKETFPQRATVVRTRSATVVEDYGPDLTKISFKGTTGFRVDKDGKTGADRMFELQALLERYGISGHQMDSSRNIPTELEFYNFTDDSSYSVHLDTEGFSIERSAQRALLYDYSINLIVLRKLSEPNTRDTSQIGNPFYESTSEVLNPNSRTSVYRSSLNALRREIP